MVTGPQTPLGAWLAAVGARTSAPGGGAAAAVTLATAAALGAMVARFSSDLFGEAGTVAGAADNISACALDLAAADEAAVAAMLRSRSRHADGEATRPPEHDGTAVLGTADDAALRGAEVPLEIVALAVELVPHLRRLVVEGNPRLAGDALTGVELALAAGRAAAGLVAIDADGLPDAQRPHVLERLRELRTALDG